VFGFPPQSQRRRRLADQRGRADLEQEYGLKYASDTRGGPPFLPQLTNGVSACPQLPTTLPTFDEILGLDGVDESSVAGAMFRRSQAADPADFLHVFTLHAELEGMLLLHAFESLLAKWLESGAVITRMAKIQSWRCATLARAA
jgi:hypothetical protein